MDDIQAAIKDLERLCEAVDELGVTLRNSKRQFRKVLGSLQDGMTVEKALERGDSAVTRNSLTQALEEFERQRHTSPSVAHRRRGQPGRIHQQHQQVLGDLPPTGIALREPGALRSRGALSVARNTYGDGTVTAPGSTLISANQ